MSAFDIKFEGIDVQTHPTGKRGRLVVFSNVTQPEAEEMARQIINVYPEINVGHSYQDGREDGYEDGRSDGWDAAYEEARRRLGALGGESLVAELKWTGVDAEVLLKSYKASYPEEFKKIAEEK